jgi:monoamine oxidase
MCSPGDGFYCGDFARAAAARSDSEIRERVLQILAEIFAIEVPAPTHFLRTRWTADPWTGGSYSYIPVGASLNDMNILAAPVGERLLFAGEATVPEYYGTVHAALTSGIREAKRLLQTATVDLSSGPAPEPGCVA